MRFMHISDIHLGASPDEGYSWAQDRGKEIWDSFRRCIHDAKEKNIDLLLISGDLFHRQPAENELREVNYLFSTLGQTAIVMIAGNHDYIQKDSPYLTFPWNKNVIGLFSPEMERIQLKSLRVEIYGFSYHSQEIRQPVYDDIVTEKNGYYKILLAHGGDASHIPIHKETLAKSGFDYIALGHIHKPQVVIPGLAMYAGALEPIDCNDLGAHGYIMGETGVRGTKLSFVNFSKRQYRRIRVELTEQDTAFSVREKIAHEIGKAGGAHMYRVYLTGKRRPGFWLRLSEYRNCGRIIEISDQTHPDFQLDVLRRQYKGQLIGDYIESFAGRELGKAEEKALYYGLEALMYSGK